MAARRLLKIVTGAPSRAFMSSEVATNVSLCLKVLSVFTRVERVLTC